MKLLRRRLERIERRVKPELAVRITLGGRVWEGDFRAIMDRLKPTRGLPVVPDGVSLEELLRPIGVFPRYGEAVEAATRRVCEENHIDPEGEEFMVIEQLVTG